MLKLFGPDIESIDALPDSGLVYIDDHIGHDNELDGFEHLNNLLANSGCCVILEYAAASAVAPEHRHRVMSLPLQTYHTSFVLSKLVESRPVNNKYSVFNFSVNKIRRNRQYLLQVLSARGLYTANYTVNWSTEVRFPNRYFVGGPAEKKSHNINNGAWTNIDTFLSYLRPAVYEPTWISVITEPGWQHQAAFVSEKTIFALETHTMPIWFGGHGQADWLKAQGFDVFDDIIDHGYQSVTDAEQRMTEAIERNIDLLCDQDRCRDFYLANVPRFEHNRAWMRSNQWFYNHMHREIQRTQWSWEYTTKILTDLVIENNYQWPMNFGRVANIGLRATLIKS